MFVAIHCHELLVGVYPNPRFAQNICGYAFDECYIKQFEILERAYIAMVILSFADAS